MRNRSIVVLLLAALLAGCGGSASLSEATSAVPSGALEISVLYGSEKQLWMEAVTQQFNSQQVRSTSGKPIYVTATAIGSNESLRQILEGEAQPTVWSPASGVLLPLANQRWAQANNGASLVEGSPPPLVLSPVVIAMWEPMARALGWPEQPLGWRDIADLASSGKTWADYGHPEWGPFQFGHTHPDYSNSGIVSVLATAYAATGKTRGLTVADVQQPQTAEFISAVESGVIHYGESTGFFADQMFTRGPGYLSAAVMYENLVVQSRDPARYRTSLPVVAVYPEEGTLWSDHPYAILDAPWVSEEQRAAAETFRDFLLERPQQERALSFGFRPADPQIALAAPIDAANGVDPREPQTLLEVPSAEVIEAVQSVWVANKKRVDVHVVLDVSGSMTDEGRLESAKVALRTFVGQLNDEDGLAVTIFGTEARELTPLTPLGPKRQQVLDQIGGLFPQGSTRLIDTVGEAYTLVSAVPSGQRIRAVVVLSDGADNVSATPAATLLERLRGETEGYSVKVFTIAYGTGTDVDVGLLEDIASASGARSYESTPTTIDRVYRDIATFF